VDLVVDSILILTLLVAVLQVAVHVHVRNAVTARAQHGARYAANAEADSIGVARMVGPVVRAASTQTPRAWSAQLAPKSVCPLFTRSDASARRRGLRCPQIVW